MKKFLSSLGLDNLLPPSLHSPFSTPTPSRPASPSGTTSRRSSSRSRSRPSSRASTKNTPTSATPCNTNNPTPTTPKNPGIVEIKALDWEYPASPFTQQQSSPRPLPFREHSSSSVVTVKTPTPPSPHQRSRSRGVVMRGAVGRRVVSPPVPEIRISGEGGRERARTGRGKSRALPPVTRGDVCRYRRHRGVFLDFDLSEGKGGVPDAGFWEGVVKAGCTAVRIKVEAGICQDTAALNTLCSTLLTANTYNLSVLLELPQSSTSTPAELHTTLLSQHTNILGLELPPPRTHPYHGVDQQLLELWKWYDEQLAAWAGVDPGIPIYISVPVGGDVGLWVDWVCKGKGQGRGKERGRWGNEVVVVDLVGDGLGVVQEGFQGIDWVRTEEAGGEGGMLVGKVEGRESCCGGWWTRNWHVGQRDTGGTETAREPGKHDKPITTARRLELRKTAISQCTSTVPLTTPGLQAAFEQGWDVGFRDAGAFWCGEYSHTTTDEVIHTQPDLQIPVGLGLSLDVPGVATGEKVPVHGAIIGFVEGWVGRRRGLWMNLNLDGGGGGGERGGKEEEEERGRERAFGEGVARGVRDFDLERGVEGG